MSAEESGPLLEQIQELLANPVVGKWFEGTWNVRTEVPILLPGGATNRIDRLMIDGKKAIVVDFKTGEKAKADHQQVSEYQSILKQMGFTEVSGFLLYTRDKEVVEVSKDSAPRIVKKKKDDNQLGLGF